MPEAAWRKKLEGASVHVVPGGRADHWILAGLLALAFLLRAWNFADIPFTHDEISALLRMHHDSFGALIAEGVAIDAHPAGVQVLEWLWTGVFGDGEVAVKLPFLLMSVAALFFLYRFAATWTNPTVALLGIAFIGTVQYTVLYGQIARPYAAGFFTCALLVDQMTRALGGRGRAWYGFALAAALCAYTHHFALLFAGLVGLATLVLAAPRQRRKVLLAGLGALVLYAPHLTILWRQLGYAGVGQWLAAPGPYWITDLMAWTFQYSVLLAVVVLAIAIVGHAMALRKGRVQGTFLLLCLFLFSVPLLVGFAYSVWRAPVLQYSVLLFSFPFLIFPLFAGWDHRRGGLALGLVLAIASISVAALVLGRRHYELFYTSKYEATVDEGRAFLQRHPDGVLLAACPPEVIAFYLERRGIAAETLPFMDAWRKSSAEITALLEGTSADRIFVGHCNGAAPELWALVRDRFPFLLERHDLVDGGWAVYGQDLEPTGVTEQAFSSVVAPMAIEGRYWAVDDLPLAHDTSGTARWPPALWDLSGREFGLAFTAPLDSISASGNDRIDISLHLGPPPSPDLMLVAELRAADSTIFYRTGPVVPGSGVLHVSVELSTIEQRSGPLQLHAYVWNPGTGPAAIARAEVVVIRGNPVQYGMFEPVPTWFP